MRYTIDCINWKVKKSKRGKMTSEIDVRKFIQENYIPFPGKPDFLTGPTSRTREILVKINELLELEKKNHGVLDVDCERISSLLSYPAGYVDKDKEIIVGLQTDKPLKRGVNPFGGIRMAKQACEEYGYKLSSEIEKIFSFRTTHNEGVYRVYTDEMKAVKRSGVITGLPDAYGRGRIIGDYRRVALYGVDLLIEEKKRDKIEIGKKLMSEEEIKLSEELAKQIDFLEKLKKMAEMYGFDISKPAESAREAVQWIYFAYLAAVKEQNGAAMSLGRVSSFLDIYFERDIEAGILDESQAQEIIDDFVLKLRLVRQLRTSDYNELFAGDPNWITESIGGMGLDSRTLVTRTSYRFLQTLYNLGPAAEPNLTVLWSSKLPEEFKRFCAKVSIDTDSLQYENDDMMRKDFGDDYGISCCVSAMKIGKQMQYFGARCNLPKVLLMAINGGKDEITGEQVGPEMPALNEGILDYNEVKERFDFYLEWLAGVYVNVMNVIHFMHDKYAYEKIEMALHDSDVERIMAFGIAGLSVLVDSLSAIKYGKVELVRNGDFKFHILGEYPRFGNDDARVDKIAAEIVQEFYNKLKKNKTYRNAKHSLSILTITSNVVYGKKTGDTPDGRKLGEPFAPGANPMHNRDNKGALASLNSVAKIPYSCCKDGISCTFSITPDALGKLDCQIANLVSILDGYFKQEGHHLNVNVIFREKLIDAMKNPEKYPHLTIRVSGYAVNFNKLSEEQKKEVIARTFHEKM